METDTDNIALERRRLDLEERRTKLELKFINRHLGVIVTLMVSVLGAYLSYNQYKISTSLDQTKMEFQRIQGEARLTVDSLTFLTRNAEKIFSGKEREYRAVRAIIGGFFPKEVVGDVLSSLAEQTLFLEDLERWASDVALLKNDPRKVVLLLDSAHHDRVYSKTQQRLGGTNADDIYHLLRPLNLRLIRDKTHSEWENEVLIKLLVPDLIIIHWSCFFDGKNKFEKAKQRFDTFVEDMNEHVKGLSILVYSRRDRVEKHVNWGRWFQNDLTI